MFEQRMNQDFGFDNSIVGNNNRIDNNVDVDINMMGVNNSGNNDMVTNNQGVKLRIQLRIRWAIMSGRRPNAVR